MRQRVHDLPHQEISLFNGEGRARSPNSAARPAWTEQEAEGEYGIRMWNQTLDVTPRIRSHVSVSPPESLSSLLSSLLFSSVVLQCSGIRS